MYSGDSGGGVVVVFGVTNSMCFFFCNFNFHLGVACIVVIQAVELWLFSGSRIRCVLLFFL